MPKERYARIATSLVHIGPARIRVAEPDQPPLFEQAIPRVAPIAKVSDVDLDDDVDIEDVDDEGSREHFTQGA